MRIPDSILNNERFRHFWSVLRSHYLLLLVPTIALVFVAGLYGVTRTRTYTARQSLVIRDDLIGQTVKPGRFEDEGSLKSAQDTVLEVARRPVTIRQALEKLGPPSAMFPMFGGGDFPSEEAIEAYQGKITVGAPNGGEFGKTDVFVLSTKESSRQRSAEFMAHLLDALDQQLRQVRGARLLSMEQELEQKVATCKESFQLTSSKLQLLEKSLGQDVGAIRSMSVEFPNETGFNRLLQDIQTEKRQSQDRLEEARQQLVLIERALEQPGNIPSTTSELFALQPALSQLFNSLLEAKKTLAIDSGKYQPDHPKLLGDQLAVDQLVSEIKAELERAEVGLHSQIEALEAQFQRRKSRHADLLERLDRLADLRVEYERLSNDVRNKRAVYEEAYSEFVEIESMRSSAAHVDVLTRVGDPQVSTSPDGLGNKAIVFVAGLGGFLVGLGLLILVAPPFEPDSGAAFLAGQTDGTTNALPSVPRAQPTVPTVSPSPGAPIAESPGFSEGGSMTVSPDRPLEPVGSNQSGTEATPSTIYANLDRNEAQIASPNILGEGTSATEDREVERAASSGILEEDSAVRDEAFASTDIDSDDRESGIGFAEELPVESVGPISNPNSIFDSLSESLSEQAYGPAAATTMTKKADALKKVLDDLRQRPVANAASTRPGNEAKLGKSSANDLGDSPGLTAVAEDSPNPLPEAELDSALPLEIDEETGSGLTPVRVGNRDDADAAARSSQPVEEMATTPGSQAEAPVDAPVEAQLEDQDDGTAEEERSSLLQNEGAEATATAEQELNEATMVVDQEALDELKASINFPNPPAWESEFEPSEGQAIQPTHRKRVRPIDLLRRHEDPSPIDGSDEEPEGTHSSAEASDPEPIPDQIRALGGDFLVFGDLDESDPTPSE